MIDSRLLKKVSATPTPGASISQASLSALPADLLEEASRRLGWAALIYAGTFFLAYFGSHFFFAGQTGTPIEDVGLWSDERATQTLVAALSIALALAVFLLSRFGRFNPQALLDIGLVFEVIGAFGISMSTYWGIFGEWTGVFMDEFPGIPWECVWIVIFPLLAPNTPGKTLLASIAAASTGLLTVVLSKAAGYTSPDAPLLLFAGYFLFTTYLCALIAFVESRVVFRFGRRLSRAREVGSYKLIKLLGKGGMGEVWVARHRMLARPAAVKLIRPEAFGADADARLTILRRFEREAQATAGLDSSHTIKLFDFGISDDGAFYYVMELLKGLSAESLVRRFGPVPAARAVQLMRQVCHSLGEAHEQNMIHRDIKPANIYICRMGPDYDFVKVLDFGLVKSTDRMEAVSTELTAEGVTTGTPAFMAPEMALGKSDIDHRADLYALGCVGYWLVTGQLVFEAENALAAIVAHVQDRPIPPTQQTELPIPSELERLLLACLEKEPERRPQSAAELDAWLARIPVAEAWDADAARQWWELHIPEADLSAAELLDEETDHHNILAVGA